VKKQIPSIKTFLDEASNASWDWELKTNRFSPSRGIFDLFDLGPADLPDLVAFQRLLHPEDQIQFEQALHYHLQNPGSPSISLTLRHQRQSGAMLHTLFLGRVIDRDENGEAVRIVGELIDLTPLLEIEKDLQLRNENLELVNEGINAGIWEWDVASGKTIWSSRLFELLGYEPGEIETSYDLFMNELVHPEHIEGLSANLENCLNHQGVYQFEFKCLCKDGAYKWFETHGAVRFDERGIPIRMIGSMLDINHRKQLEEKNLRSIDILTSNNQRLLNFAYIVSHNLRSHSANLISLLEIFNEGDVEQKGEVYAHLKTNAVELFQTIEHLADVVKVQTALDKKKQWLGFEAYTKRVINGLSETIGKVRIKITTDFHEAPEVEYIPSYLESILHNLISNAIRYRHPQRNPTCAISTRKTENGIFLICADNGIGIDLDQHQDKLFGLYKTFHGNANARGVGLFLIKNQIESLGGTIAVASKVNEGSTFTISFSDPS